MSGESSAIFISEGVIAGSFGQTGLNPVLGRMPPHGAVQYKGLARHNVNIIIMTIGSQAKSSWITKPMHDLWRPTLAGPAQAGLRDVTLRSGSHAAPIDRPGLTAVIRRTAQRGMEIAPGQTLRSNFCQNQPEQTLPLRNDGRSFRLV
jgi:hypothetical protein